MVRNEKADPIVLSTRRFLRAESIDGGDTIVLCFHAANGEAAAIMIPREAAEAAQAALKTEFRKPLSPARPSVS